MTNYESEPTLEQISRHLSVVDVISIKKYKYKYKNKKCRKKHIKVKTKMKHTKNTHLAVVGVVLPGAPKTSRVSWAEAVLGDVV